MPAGLIEKEKYRQLCREEPSIPVSSRDWWLDAACGEDNWQVAIIERQGKIIASMPYFTKYRMGRKILTQPSLTQRLGPWIRYEDNMKHSSRISYEIDVMTSLIEKLPSFDLFLQTFDFEITNWLAFYWKGFRQQTSYSYIINDISNPELVLSNFSRSKRNDVNKARKRIKSRFDLPAEDFYRHHEFSLAQQKKKISYRFEHFRRLYDAGYKNHAARVVYAVDKDDNVTSALFTIWDSNSANAVLSTIDPRFRNSGSFSLLVYEMISFLRGKTKSFNFGGSTIKNVEYSYRQFGTRQVPMFKVSKTNSKLIALYNLYKQIY